MASPIGSILRKLTKQDHYNCLTFPTHERFQSNLAGTKCDYFMLQGTPGVKGNGWVTQYAPIPRNHILLPKCDNPLQSIPAWLNIDFVMGQHKFGQAQTALELSKYWNVPSILLEHTTVTSEALRSAVPELKKIRGNINVFISKQSAEAWDWDLNDPSVRIVHHGVDTELFKPNGYPRNQPYILSIVNDWRNRGYILGWDIFDRVVNQNKLANRILGDNPGISRPANTVYDLVNEYNQAAVFYNTSRFSPIPSVMLEAMSCGLPVVSTDNYLISDIIVNGHNGYKTNSEDEQLRHLRRLLKDDAERVELGKNARETITKNFPLDRFIQAWNNIFDEVIELR